MIIKRLAFLLPALLLLNACAQSNQYSSLKVTQSSELVPEPIKANTLGIAFGGGGIRGYMHLGVIKALEENHIKADLVTGSSAGSIAATFYASGQTYNRLETTLKGFSPFQIADFVVSSKGLINGRKLAEWVNAEVPQDSLSQMPIPIGITATDMTTHTSVLIQDGDPGKAVQTSSTIPGAFIPVEHNQHLLVDGGVLSVVPIDYAKLMGADIVLGIDIYCGNQPKAEITAFNMQLAAFRLLTCKLGESEMRRADILIQPHYEPKNPGLFSPQQEAINAGYQAMMAKMPELKALLTETNK